MDAHAPDVRFRRLGASAFGWFEEPWWVSLLGALLFGLVCGLLLAGLTSWSERRAARRRAYEDHEDPDVPPGTPR